jgi:O-antigen/teichoic acid export membrane protein
MLYKNLLSGVFSKLVSLVLSLLFVPIFFKSLGNEAYGMIGVMTMILSGLGLMDLGLGNILSKELAQRRAANNLGKSLSLIRSIEWLYFLMGVFILIILVFASFIIVPIWLSSQDFPKSELTAIFLLIAAVIFVQWPISLYNSGLFGLNKQVVANLYATIFSILKTLGAFVCLLIFGKTIYVFLLWLLGVNLLYTLTLWVHFRKLLPRQDAPIVVGWQQLSEIKKMTVGFSVLGVLVFVMTDVDKMIISKLLTLSQYGLYSFIFVIVTSYQLVSTTLKNAFFPDIAKDVLAHKPFSKFSRFNFYSKFFNFIFLPTSIFLFVFSKEILEVWSGDTSLSNVLYRPFQWLLLGSMFNGIMYTANNYLLAMERFSFLIKTYALTTLFFLPAVYFLSLNFHLEGACFSWFILNVVLFVVIMATLLIKYSNGWNRTWFLLLAKPFFSSILIVIGAKCLVTYWCISINYITLICLFGVLNIIVLGSDKRFRIMLRPILG